MVYALWIARNVPLKDIFTKDSQKLRECEQRYTVKNCRRDTARNNFCLDCTHRTQGVFWSCAGSSELISWLDGRYLKSDSDIFAISLDVSCLAFKKSRMDGINAFPKPPDRFWIGVLDASRFAVLRTFSFGSQLFQKRIFEPWSSEDPKICDGSAHLRWGRGGRWVFLNWNWNWGRRWRESLGLTTFHGGYNELQHVPTLQWLYHVVSLIYIYIYLS